MKCKYPQYIDRKKSDALRRCGWCLNCRINDRTVWAHRILLEQKNHVSSVFLTLTYSDDHLPRPFVIEEKGKPLRSYKKWSVNPDHHRLFMNNLRYHFKQKTGSELRFYGCGEYGEKTQRPHYHYALFGYPECQLGSSWRGRVFVPCKCPPCSLISTVWGRGHIFSGSLTSDSANYIAGYVTKKLTSEKSKKTREILDGRHPEFCRMSRSPGIGACAVDWISQGLTRYTHLAQDDLPRTLIHGSKVLPLGRYLSEKLHEKMGFEKAPPQENIHALEVGMRDVLLRNADYSPYVARAIAQGSVATALQFLNAQSALNLESKTQLFSKGKRI